MRNAFQHLQEYFRLSYMALIILLPSLGFAQAIHVSGKAVDRPNQLVRILVFSDQFSYLEETIASTYTDDQGNFSLDFEHDAIDYAFLALNLDKGEFYLKPGASYTFTINPDTSKARRSYFDKMPLSFVMQAEDDGLNAKIERFNAMFNTFVVQNFNSIYKSKSASVLNDFEQVIRETFPKDTIIYFDEYIAYKLASLQWISKKKHSQKIIDTYYSGKPILFNNIEYTGFFNELFEQYPSNHANLMPYSEIVLSINERTSYASLDAILARDTLLQKDQQLRELVALLSLSKYFYIKDFRRDQVVKVIRQIERNSPYPENRLVAANYLIKLSRLSYGSPAPRFKLLDAEGNFHRIEDYSDSFVLLNFVDANCKLCFQYTPLLKELQEHQAHKLKIVTIAVNDPDNSFHKYNQSRDFNWPCLQLGDSILLLEEYDIRTFPSYVILNPDGSIAMSPAPMPEENLEFFLGRFIQKYENEN